MDYEGSTASIERASDLERNPAGVVKRWLLELRLADKRESDWRKKAEKVWKKYRQQDTVKAGAFNILWANTETLRPAVYNSLPKPDVRRRYKDADPLGKAVAEVLSRSLEYGLDVDDFNGHIERCVLDMLLPGRGVARVRYVPSLAQVGVDETTHTEENEQHGEPAGEAMEGYGEELEWEQAPVEHVQWSDFRLGPGKCWAEVPWVSFDHRLTRAELEEQFGDVGGLVSLDACDDDELKSERDDAVKDSFKTALVHEIWDKDTKRVLFICAGYKDAPLKSVDDPLALQGFFPIPRPLYAIEDSSSTVPVPLYELYRQQAEELDSISQRINIIVKGLRLRGIYDSTISEMAELMRGNDNDLIPAQNVTALLERGGLEKAIWMWPVETAAQVLRELYVQRDQCKQIVYEVTGISDILRGSTKAQETATAQQIKAQWGGNRIKRMQAEVARFIRDLMRLQAEIIGEKFAPETLQQMTGLQFPSAEQKQQALALAVQSGQQPSQMPPSWDEIIQILRDDKWRTFKVDVENESTIAATLEGDMDAMQKLMGGIVQLVQGLGPAVQMQAIPVEAVKELILAITRRAKLGNAVEDALDKIQQPPPQGQDNSQAIKQAVDQAVAHEQQKSEMQQQMRDMQAGMEQKFAQAMTAKELESIRAEYERDLNTLQEKIAADEKYRAEQLKAETQVVVALIDAGQKDAADTRAAAVAARQTENEGAEAPEPAEQGEDMGAAIRTALEGFQVALERLSQPRTIVRGPDGRAVGIQ